MQGGRKPLHASPPGAPVAVGGGGGGVTEVEGVLGVGQDAEGAGAAAGGHNEIDKMLGIGR